MKPESAADCALLDSLPIMPCTTGGGKHLGATCDQRNARPLNVKNSVTGRFRLFTANAFADSRGTQSLSREGRRSTASRGRQPSSAKESLGRSQDGPDGESRAAPIAGRHREALQIGRLGVERWTVHRLQPRPPHYVIGESYDSRII